LEAQTLRPLDHQVAMCSRYQRSFCGRLWIGLGHDGRRDLVGDPRLNVGLDRRKFVAQSIFQPSLNHEMTLAPAPP
jgi:hypothetical protein